jgi:hypothetical protein
MLTITSCGAEPINPVSGPEAAAAYGNISLPEGNISNVLLYKVGEGDAPPIQSPHQCHTYTNGDYFIENLEPGKYFLMGFTAGKQKFNFNYQGLSEAEFIKDAAVEIKRGSITYFGSYDVKGIDQKFQKSAAFEITHSKTAAKILILKHLKEDAQGTGWDKRIDRAMM